MVAQACGVSLGCMTWAVGAVIAALVLVGCGGQGGRGDTRSPAASRAAGAFPVAPAVRDGPLNARVEGALADLLPSALSGTVDREALAVVAASGDARLGWFVSDMLRFATSGEDERALVSAFRRLSGVDVHDDASSEGSVWRTVTDHLIAWDLPAPPGYRERKGRLFLALEPRWKPFFADAGSDIDWRLISWGGVLIDDRPAGDRDPCPRSCIPALDDPALTAAAEGDWYPDERTVFGVVVGDEAVAFPQNVMEVHEMVNITVGGRRLGIPYCTLCGSAQAYFLDAVPEGVTPPVLRTSGLLSRSNKVMYDLMTRSVLDTFTGRALSGPLRDARVTLEQATVVTGSWGEWKQAHPDTRIVAEDGGIGREYDDDPLGGRDDDGPIFPVGDVDPRLPVQAAVLGVIAPGGEAVAFAVDAARAALAEEREVAAGGVEVVADAGGLRARSRAGQELPAHQAFWFAWSQFHPGTQLWTRPG